MDWIAEDLKGLAIEVESLTLDPANARLHPQRNMDAIRASLRRFGQRKPIVVRRDGMVVVAGNGTLHAARSLGWSHVAAVVVDDDATTATGYAIADNRTAELAEWDENALSRLLKSAMETTSLEDLGLASAWTQEDLDILLSEQDSPEVIEWGEDEVDKTPAERPGSSPEGDGVLRQLIIHVLQTEYAEVMEKVNELKEREGLANNAEVFLWCLRKAE
jgi:ParB-like chromosome segregation protein Spo0J